MTDTREVHHIEHGGGYATIDSRNFPINVIWWGGMMNPTLYDKVWEYRNQYLVDRSPVIIIINDINDGKPVDATTRKYLADKGKNDPRLQSGEILAVMVVSNAILRGVLTAVTWMAGDKFPMEFGSTLEQGYQIARKLLERHDVPNIPNIDPSAFTIHKNPNAQL